MDLGTSGTCRRGGRQRMHGSRTRGRSRLHLSAAFTRLWPPPLHCHPQGSGINIGLLYLGICIKELAEKGSTLSYRNVSAWEEGAADSAGCLAGAFRANGRVFGVQRCRVVWDFGPGSVWLAMQWKPPPPPPPPHTHTYPPTTTTTHTHPTHPTPTPTPPPSVHPHRNSEACAGRRRE